MYPLIYVRKEITFPILTENRWHETNYEVAQATHGVLRVNDPGDIRAGSSTAMAMRQMQAYYDNCTNYLVDRCREVGYEIRREAETEPLVFSLEDGIFGMSGDRIALVVAREDPSVGKARMAIGNLLVGSEPEPRRPAFWVIQTRGGDGIRESSILLRPNEHVILLPGQLLYQWHPEGGCRSTSVIWTEHWAYSRPRTTPEPEPDHRLETWANAYPGAN